jgi:two-component system, OmpR family, sensor histidine kinase KdpD
MKERFPPSDRLNLVLATVAIAGVTGLRFWFHLTNPTIAALSYLLIVLITATASSLTASVAVSVLADLCLNYFFMPPIGTFTIADTQNWVALVAFLAVATVASNLSTTARARAREALARRDELGRLFDLSRDVLLTSDSKEAMTQLAGFIARRFELDFAAICLPRPPGWNVSPAGSLAVTLDSRQLSLAFRDADRTVVRDADPEDGHQAAMVEGELVRLVPLRFGAKAVGLLATAGRPVEAGTLDAVAGVAAIAVERAQFLEERKAAELARQSEELKSALLASLGHDLRTPLTAIRVAASNLQASWLHEADRREQSDLILAEVERLNRLFQNILEMARIDAGAVAADVRWVYPAEIFEAACDQVEHALRRHHVELRADSDSLVRLDPRLTASALAHLLENAAQYAGVDAPIEVAMSAADDGLEITVRDHGQGISPVDLPHVFDRFYRGAGAKLWTSGTGMGLSIARGMLAAEGGRIQVENCRDGGARFTIAVPAAIKAATAAGPTP